MKMYEKKKKVVVEEESIEKWRRKGRSEEE